MKSSTGTLKNGVFPPPSLLFRFEDQLDSWLVDHMRAILNPREYVSHPISSFQLIKRLTVDWADLKEHVIDKAPANVTGR